MVCKKCNIEKEIEFFRKYKVSHKLYTRKLCKSCESKNSAIATLKVKTQNREKYLKSKRKSYSKNKEKYKKYREKHKEIRAKNNKEWKLNNREKCTEVENRRRAKKLNATPSWLTEKHIKEIQNIYKECAKIAKETGIKHNVDHIIPLQGVNVSGMHVPWNLQILTAENNSKKGNRIII